MWLWVYSILACNNIKGKWRDYAFNTDQIPATYCETNTNCWLIEQFSMELNDEYDGDFRIQIGKEGEHYIYTLPMSAERSGRDWLMSVDNSDFTKIAEEWICDVTGRLMVCTVSGEEYQFRRGGYPD